MMEVQDKLQSINKRTSGPICASRPHVIIMLVTVRVSLPTKRYFLRSVMSLLNGAARSAYRQLYRASKVTFGGPWLAQCFGSFLIFSRR